MKKAKNRYCRFSKISEYRFERLLRYFAEDVSPAEVARKMRLSGNTVNNIYRRLRCRFAILGLFRDSTEFDGPLFASDYAHAIWDHHRQRTAAKYGLRELEPGGFDLHRAESYWRFRQLGFVEPKHRAHIHDHMYADLVHLLKLCGPLGAEPRNSLEALEYIEWRTVQHCEWLKRNAPACPDPELDLQLHEIEQFKNEMWGDEFEEIATGGVLDMGKSVRHRGHI